MERRTEHQIKGILPFVCEFWDFIVSWICILNEQRSNPEPKKQEKGLEKVSTNRLHTKQNTVFRVCWHLELFVSSCSWELPCVVKKRENVLKPRSICWRKRFLCDSCVSNVCSHWRLEKSCIISASHQSSTQGKKQHLRQGSTAPELRKTLFCQLQRHC